MNEMAVNGSAVADHVTPATLFGNLPNVTSSFEADYRDQSNLTLLYDDVFAERDLGKAMPYRFGSYGVYQANKASQTYQISNYINLTS